MVLPPSPDQPRPRRGAAPEAGFVRAVLDQVSDLVVVVDATGRVVFASDASLRMLGHEPSSWIGRPVFELVHPDDQGLAAESMADAVESGLGVKEPVELRVRHLSGAWRTVEVVGNNLLHDPEVAGMVLSVRELGGRAAADAAARRARRRFELVFERAPIGMALCALDGRFERVNALLCRMLHRSATELLTRSVLDVTAPDQRVATRRRVEAVVAGELAQPSTEQRFLRADGSMVWVRTTVSAIHDDEGEPSNLLIQVEDVEERRELTEQLEAAATHDPLTGVLNRAGLTLLLDEHLARPSLGSIGLLFVDLDHFKHVNDTHGHAAGDQLLVAVADRITGAIRDRDVCARTGGDEFVVVCVGLDRPRRAVEVAERVRAALEVPFRLGGVEARISGSIGVAVSHPGSDQASLMASADAAAYRAKSEGKNRVATAP